jgi:hypothetical protein
MSMTAFVRVWLWCFLCVHASDQNSVCAHPRLKETLTRWFKDAKVPGNYIGPGARVKTDHKAFDLTRLPTYSFGEHGIGTNWVHHTRPAENFESTENLKSLRLSIANLLRRGISRLEDAVYKHIDGDDILLTDATISTFLSSVKKLIRSYEDFYEQISNTLARGPEQIYNPGDNEYGPETNFWVKFRGYISCHHSARLGPEVGGNKFWCNPEYLESKRLSRPRNVLSAGSGGDFTYEEHVATFFPNVTIVTPDCTTIETVRTESTGRNATILLIPVCITGDDPNYLRGMDASLQSKFMTFTELLNQTKDIRGDPDFMFDVLKVNIEGFEYPMFAHIFKDPENLLRGTAQVHLELHRQGMQRFGLSWSSLLYGELLLAHFFSGGYIPFATEKWHDSTATTDMAFVNQSWFIESEMAVAYELMSDVDPFLPPRQKACVEAPRFCPAESILDSKSAELLIKEAEITGWDLRPDLVDLIPEWTLNAYYCPSSENCLGYNPNLGEFSRNMTEEVMKTVEEKASMCPSIGGTERRKIKIYWSYIKKYSADTRDSIILHVDSSDVTGVVLLSNPKDVVGGEYFLMTEQDTKSSRVARDDSEPWEVFVNRRNELYNHLQAGDAWGKYTEYIQQGHGVIHAGQQGHAVGKVTSGTRYSFVFFANYVDTMK